MQVYREIQEYFKLSLPSRGFLSRGKDESKKKNLYFTTEQVSDLTSQDRTGQDRTVNFIVLCRCGILLRTTRRG